MAVRCGKHGRENVYHASVAEVRLCYQGRDVEALPRNGRSIFDDLDEVNAGQAAINKAGKTQNYHGPDGLTSCGAGCCDPFPRGARLDGPESAEFEQVNIPGLGEVPLPKRSKSFDPNELEDGFYALANPTKAKPDHVDIYKVVVAVHGSGNKYAKQLDLETGEWNMAWGAIKRLRPEDRMTLEQALKVAKAVATDVEGRLYGRCFVCGRTLTAEDSIERFMGPICASRFG